MYSTADVIIADFVVALVHLELGLCLAEVSLAPVEELTQRHDVLPMVLVQLRVGRVLDFGQTQGLADHVVEAEVTPGQQGEEPATAWQNGGNVELCQPDAQLSKALRVVVRVRLAKNVARVPIGGGEGDTHTIFIALYFRKN